MVQPSWSEINIKYRSIKVKYTAGKKLEACGININLNQKPITIISIYKLPDITLSTTQWEKFFNQFPEEFMIGGDFNAHHSSDPRNDSAGITLVDALDNLNLHCINNGSMTRFGSGLTHDSAIDLTISNCTSLLTARWEVIQEAWGSDHLPIKIEIMGSAKNHIRFNMSSRIYSSKTDWKAVQNNLLSRIPECTELRVASDIDCQSRYTSLMALVENCVKMSTPSRNKNPYNTSRTDFRKSSMWWDEECEKAIRIRKAAFLKFKYISSQVNYEKYKQTDDDVRALFRRKKKSSFIDFCDSLNRTSNMRLVWQKIRAMSNKYHREEMSNVYKEEHTN